MDDKKVNILQNIAETILKKTNQIGLDSELNLIYKSEATTRYANSQITQNMEELSISIDLTVSKGKKFASEKTTDISEKGIETLVSNVKENIEGSPEVPFYQGFVNFNSNKYPKVEMNSKFWDVEKRANKIKEIIDFTESISKNVKLAGTCASEDSIYLFKSSNGRENSFPFIINHFKVNAIYQNGQDRGYGQNETYWRKNEPNYREMTENSLNVAKSTINVEKSNSGEFKVILSPQAVSDLLIFIQYTLLASYFHGGQCFTSELNKQVFDEKFDISDLPLDSTLSRVSLPIDAEGNARSNKKVINNGFVIYLPYTSFEASQYLKDKSLATGDSFEQNFAICTSFVQTPGSSSSEELIKDVNNGLFINRFWYSRITDPTTGGLTGVTRYGVFKIENGELGSAVNNLRFNDAFTSFWKQGNILGIGKEQFMNEINTTCSMALEKFKFSSII